MRHVISRAETKWSGPGWNFSNATAVKNIACVVERAISVEKTDYATAFITVSFFATAAPIPPGKARIASNYAISAS